MDAKAYDKARLPSRHVTEGPERAPHRSYYFSGATRGFCIGHVGPEAQSGGPIALIRDGDIIAIDAANGTLDVELAEEELEHRRSAWKPHSIMFGSGALWKYAQSVGPAFAGAVTHPGGEHEGVCFADM